MEKIITSDAQESLHARVGTFVQVWESGRHLKQASSPLFSQAEMEEFAPPKGQFLSRSVSLGNHELFGANRNCWFAGERVRTAQGYAPIEEIQEGDQVVDAFGKLQTVTRLWRRDYTGPAISVRLQGLMDPVRCTEEHPLRGVKRKWVTPKRLYYAAGREGENGSEKAQDAFSKAVCSHTGFEEAGALIPGDWLCVPTTEEAVVQELYHDPWVYGLFLGDGCTVKEYRGRRDGGSFRGVVFTLGEGDDAGVIPRLQGIVTASGRTAGVGESYTSAKGRRLHWNLSSFADEVTDLFGAGSRTVDLASSVFSLKEEDKLRLLAGWFDADGCLVRGGAEKYRGTLSVSSASRDLISSAQRLLASVGIPSSASRGCNYHEDGCFGTKDHAIFSLAIGPAYSDRILRHSARMQPHGREVKTSRTQRIVDGQLWFKVLEVTATHTEEPCYNLEVEGSHTYVTSVAGHNCDGYPDAELKKSHNTFLTHGRVYREHRNKDPKNAIGTIKAAKYDSKLGWGELLYWTEIEKAASEFEAARKGEEQHTSMACFPAGTPVQLPDGGEMPIEKIEPGTRVLTHRGNVGVTSHLHSREYDGRGIRFHAAGLPEDLLTTEEHPIWIRPDVRNSHDCPVCGERFNQLRSHLWQKKDTKHQAAYVNFGKAAEGWRRADELLPGDWVRTPFDKVTAAGGDETYAALLGWYAAEGNIFDSEKYTEAHWCMDFTLNISEVEYAEEIVGLLRKLGVRERQISVYKEPKVSRMRVRCRNVELLQRVKKDAGAGCADKYFSEEVMRWAPPLQKIIVEKAIEGDGTWHKHAKHLSVSTVSRRLAWQYATLLWRNDIPALLQNGAKAGTYTKVWRNPSTGQRERHTGVKRRSYNVVVSPRDLDRLSVSKRDTDFQFTFSQPARDISHLRHQTAGTQSKVRKQAKAYCFIEGAYIYHRVRKVTSEPLQATVYDLTVPGDHGFVVSGVGVSNCSVTHDNCDGCGYKSARPSDRCDHIRNTPGAYLKEFQKFAHMINYGMVFKDQSWVGRPADRIANTRDYIFAKAASINRELRGDELAAAYYGSPWVESLRELAAFDEPSQDPSVKFARQNIWNNAVTGQLDDSLVSAMAVHTWPARVFRSLQKRAMVLPLASFEALISNRSVAASLADPVVVETAGKMAAIRAIIISRSENEPEFGSAFDEAANQLEPSNCECGDKVDTMLDIMQDQFSCRYELLSKRALTQEPQLPVIVKAGAPSSEALALGAVYNAYLLQQKKAFETDIAVKAGGEILAALR